MKLSVLILTIITFSYSNLLLSQGEGNNWYFGYYAGLNFSTNPPTILNDGHLVTSEGCASVSGKNGVLAFYTDGMFVWDANHNLMPNGSGLLGNPSSTQSSVICPKPGTYNYGTERYDGYFIVTIDYVAGPNGVRFTEVDMTLNGGMGDIVATNKNILLFGTTTMEGANVAKHANGCDYWIVGKPVGDNNVFTYHITSAGVNLTPVISPTGPVISAGWGTIKVSPNNKIIGIAALNAGADRSMVYDFNNATGTVTHRYSTDKGRYSLEFSPDSKILYVTGLDDPSIYQYDLTTTNQAAFIATEVIVGTTANVVGYRMCGLQLAPNGKIYAALQSQERLGAINNPNILGLGCNYNDNEQSLVGVNSFSGAAMYSILGLPAFPSFFVTEKVGIQASYLCFNDNTTLKLSDTSNINSVDWFWTESGNTFPLTPNSTNREPTIQYANTGDYDVMAIAHYPCFIDSIYRTITITNVNEVKLGNDTIMCFGNSTTLDAGVGYDYYEWHDGSSSQTFLADTSGQYTVEVSNIGANLIYNGDFESGNTGFTSVYNYATSLSSPGSYAINTLSNTWGGNCVDHTTGGGLMMEVDGACGSSGVPGGANLWCQTLDISPNTDYYYSIWAANATPGAATSIIGVFINGIQETNPLNTTTTACAWQEITGIWNSGANNTIDICLKELSMVCGGNDFIIDDIFFAPLCKASDTINVTIGKIPTASFSLIDSCENFNVFYSDLSTITMPESIASWSWDIDNDGTEDYTSQNPNHLFSAGNYTSHLTITSALGCSHDTTMSVRVYPKPQADFNFTEMCQYDSLSFIDASIVSGADVITSFSWNFGENAVPAVQSTLNNPYYTYNSAQVFTVTEIVTTSNGCLDTISKQVEVFDVPTASFNFVNRCLNDSVPFTSTSTISLPSNITNYGWSFGDGQSSTLQNPNHLFANDGIYNVQLITISNHNCSDTAENTITMNTLPTALISGDTTVCKDDLFPTITFTGATSTAPYTFNYTINGGQIQSVVSSGDIATIAVPTTNAGTFNYELISVTDASSNGCKQVQTGTTIVTINALPLATLLGTATVCQDDSSPIITFTGSNSTAPYTFAYTINGGPEQSIVSVGNSATINAPTNTPGVTSYQLLGVTDAGSTACQSDLNETILITISPLPTGQLIGGESLCLNSGIPTIEFIGANGGNPYTFSYTINNGTIQTIASSFGQSNVVLSLDASTAGTTIYNLVSVSESGMNCSQNQTGSATITIHPEPIALFEPSPDKIKITDNVSQMINNSVGATIYDWSFSDGTSSSQFSPYHQFEIDEEEQFNIQLIATNEFGCFSIATGEIIVLEDEIIYIPNTFTPNGNEYNSVFIPVLDERTKIYEYQMEIFNRWGESIFISKDISIGWDGTYNGNYSQSGIYTWVISYKVKNSTDRRILNGHVNILK